LNRTKAKANLNFVEFTKPNNSASLVEGSLKRHKI
jgi:hypothetical protein